MITPPPTVFPLITLRERTSSFNSVCSKTMKPPSSDCSKGKLIITKSSSLENVSSSSKILPPSSVDELSVPFRRMSSSTFVELESVPFNVKVKVFALLSKIIASPASVDEPSDPFNMRISLPNIALFSSNILDVIIYNP